jgi:hypothetical protein
MYLVPPPTSSANPFPSNLESGTVGLYPDANWDGNPVYIKTSNYTEKVQASLSEAVQDSCTWVAFNLPAGTVLTLLQNPSAPVAGQPYDFANAGICVDLIGNGTLQTIDLTKIGANDSISAFVWRRVDYKAGIFQLFDEPDCSGFGNTFFLAEWPADTIHTFKDWRIWDQAASVYYGGLGVTAVTLYDGLQGDGQAAQFAGWLGNTGGINGDSINLYDRGFGDKQASWKWAPLPPVYQTVEPFTVNGTFSVDDSLSVTMHSSGSNAGDSTVEQTAKFLYSISQQATVTVTNTSTETYTQTTDFTFGQTINIPFVGSTSFEFLLNVGFSEEFSESISETDTTTQTLAVELDQVVSVPANSTWQVKLLLQYAKVPPTSFTTGASYYYKDQVPGSVLDPAIAAQLGYAQLYRLDTTISGYVSASLAVNALSTVTTTPIGSSDSTTTTSVIETIPAPALLAD